MIDEEAGPCPCCGVEMNREEEYGLVLCYDCGFSFTIDAMDMLRILQRNAALAKAGERLREEIWMPIIPKSPLTESDPIVERKDVEAYDAERKRWDDD